MNPDPLGTRSPSVFDALAGIGAKRPVSSGVRQALTSADIPFRPTLAAPKAPTLTPPSITAVAAPLPAAAPMAAPQAFAFNPDEDPIVQMVKAAGLRSVHDAGDTEVAGRKKVLIDYGYDPALSSKYADASNAEAAKQNPFSFLANLRHGYDVAGHNLDEGLNKQNLYYSSERGTQLGELARNEQQQEATGYGNLQHTLGALSDALLKAQSDADAASLNAAGQAYDRYTPPETFLAAAAAGGAPATAAPQLPAYSPEQTTLPTYSPQETTLPPFPQATESLPTNSSPADWYSGQLDDQVLAELARIRRQS